MLRLFRLLTLCLLLTPLTSLALSTQPIARIATDMHTAPIRRIAVDAAQRYVVTASHDKTARVWELATGKLLNVLRVPIGEGHEGKLYAVAISPDGQWVALGGWTSPDGRNNKIYLFNRLSGQLSHHISGLPNRVKHLSFSADGAYLAAALGGGAGIRVYASGDNWREVAQDSEYGADSYSVAFDASGRLLSSSFDGKLRLYDAQFKLLYARSVADGKQPYDARFSPDGRLIAVGFHDSTAVSVLSGEDLQLRYQVDSTGVDNGNLSGVAWSADGAYLYAAGRNDLGDGTTPIRVWSQQGRGAMQTWAMPNVTSTIMSLQPLAQGELLFAAADPAWGVLNAQGQLRYLKTGELLDHRGNFEAFRLAEQGDVLEFGLMVRRDGAWHKQLARFDLKQRRLTQPSASSAQLSPPNTTALPISNWEDHEKPQLAQQALTLETNEFSYSLAIAADKSWFVLGTEWHVRLFNAQGQQRWQKPVPGVAWQVNLSRDGRYVVAALGDGTIRWYRTQDGSEALALFVHADGKRWVLWTPEGFYDASEGGEELLVYHLNQGEKQAGEVVSAAQLRDQFRRGDLINKRLEGDEVTIKAEVARLGDVRKILAAGLPPHVRLLSAAEQDSTGEYELALEIEARQGGIGSVQISVNGVPIAGRADPPTGGRYTQRVRLPQGLNQVSAVVFDKQGKIASEPVVAKIKVAASGNKPTLHIVALGISQYRDNSLTQGVRFAARDAHEFASTLQRYGLSDVMQIAPPVVITDQAATRERLQNELAAIAQRAQPDDMFVLFLAGHAMSLDDGEYYYLPHELRYSGQAAVQQKAVSGAQLRTWLRSVPASKRLVILDTCNSGRFSLGRDGTQDKATIDRFARLSGSVTLAAAGDKRMALESPDKQHGIYTSTLIRGLQGSADTNRNGKVEISELADYVEEEVARISLQQFGYEQVPMKDIQGQNFPVSRGQQ